MRPGVPAGLDAVIARAMAKNPDDRYRSAAVLAAAARRALDSDTAAAIPRIRSPLATLNTAGAARRP